jgi:hypothetical protein
MIVVCELPKLNVSGFLLHGRPPVRRHELYQLHRRYRFGLFRSYCVKQHVILTRAWLSRSSLSYDLQDFTKFRVVNFNHLSCQ